MINRRSFLTSTASASALFAGGSWLNWAHAADYSKRALDLVAGSGAIDMLGLITIGEKEWERWAYSAEGMTAVEIERFRTCGIKALHHAHGLIGADVHGQALQFFGDLNAFIARYSDLFTRIHSARDLEAIRHTDKIGIIPGLQTCDQFRKPDDVKVFYKLGQRVSQLTYNSQNLLGCGATERQDCGISDFGVAIIGKMNEIGMLVDVSHCGERTTLDAFEISKKPVAITHSNCKALLNHPRLKTDEAIKKMAKTGGVMGITGVRQFVRGEEPTNIEHLVDHIDHVARLVGVEHVGIGSDADLNGYDDLPPDEQKRLRAAYKASYAFRDKLDVDGFNHPKKIFDLAEALIRRKYSDANIQAILGGNFRRLLTQVWTV